MEFVGVLVLFPFLVAAILALTKNDGVRRAVVYVSSAVIIAVAICFSVSCLVTGNPITGLAETETIDIIMMCGEVFLMGLIIVLSIKAKKVLPIVLSVLQTGAILWFELCAKEEGEAVEHMRWDNLTLVMVLIVAIVGCLICVYANGYLKDYHHHHTEYKDRRPFFFGMLFVFLGAMFGLVLSDNLIWMYFFWEITSVSSFLLIGYTKTEEAVTNSFRALWMNLLGGVGFCGAIIFLEMNYGVASLTQLLTMDKMVVVFPVLLLAFAGLTKSAQFPFSKWLLGAMVAPTPSSALLHSATMVKAGVYLLLRLAPLMMGTVAGTMVSLIGGLTFFVASILAITQSDGKSVLAFSTISNLGLITACAGVGTSSAVWAGVVLVIFHAVSKSLLFQTVGSVEHTIGSRDIEDMAGLIKTYPILASALVIGICGMFLAPFGMLVSKWAVLKSFIDAGNVLLVVFICFGSATTLFYWTKWLTKIIVQMPREKQKNKTTANQLVSIGIHATLVVLLCLTLPIIVDKFVNPLLMQLSSDFTGAVISSADLIMMSVMLVALVVVPLISGLATKGAKVTKVNEYMSGINTGTNEKFVDSFDNEKTLVVANWYMKDLIDEDKWMMAMYWLGSAVIVICTVLSLTGGAM